MRLKTLSSTLCGLAAFSGVAVAQAAPADFVIILLDATGSMYPDNWKNAISQAKSTVQDYVAKGQNDVERAFAIYTFKTDTTTGQDGIKQVWPTAQTVCSKVAPGTTTFCTYGADNKYTQLLGTAAALGELDTVVNLEGPINGMPRTPLARSMCDTIAAMKNAALNTNATIVLESDGAENETPIDHLCGGPDAAVDPSFTFVNSAPDRGYPLVDGEVSWQAKVLRRSFKYDATPSSANDLSQPVAANAAFPATLAWKVTALYTFYPANATSSPMMLAPTSSTSKLAAFALPDNAQPTFAQQLLRASAGFSQPASLQSTGGTTSMSRGEIELFRALGSVTSRSSYKEIVTVYGQPTVYGVDHKVAGDVDDSGCSDIADYRIITQRDVWMQRAVRPLEIAIRADLNRDGWVDQKDINVLLANWGRGCINPVQPPPK